jgi:hypothetical protein
MMSSPFEQGYEREVGERWGWGRGEKGEKQKAAIRATLK